MKKIMKQSCEGGESWLKRRQISEEPKLAIRPEAKFASHAFQINMIRMRPSDQAHLNFLIFYDVTSDS